MKHARKLVSILLVLAMALTLGVAAFAAETGATTGSITVTNPKKDANDQYATYTAYKIFDLVYNDNAHTYTIDETSAWYSVVTDFIAANSDLGLELQDYTEGKKLVNAEEAFDETAAAAFAAYLKANQPAGATAAATLNEDNSFTATGLDLGYYFVDSNLGTLCSLDSTNALAEITEKNEVPQVDKEVEEDSDKSWGNRNDADLGQTVNYKTTITVAAGNEGYILHDKMTNLTLVDNSIVVTVDGAKVEAAGNYSVITPCSDDCTFEIEFEDSYIVTLASGTEIIVTYSAVVNDDAPIATALPNETWLNYGEKSEFESTHSKTETFVWEFGVNKIIAGTTNPLAGAKFTLSKSEDGSNPLTFTQAETVYTYDEEGTVTEFETTETGNISIKGLDADTYYLTETAAPAGYNMLTAPIKVVIDHDGNVFFDDAEEADTDKIVEVENNTGTELPETGGMGTTILYIIGGLLAVGAIVLLVSKKRMSMADAAE